MLKVIKANEKYVGAVVANSWDYGKFLNYDFLGYNDSDVGVVYNDSKDLKVFNQFKSTELKAFFHTMNQYYKAGYIPTAGELGYGAKDGAVFAILDSDLPAYDSKADGYDWENVYFGNPVITTVSATTSMQAISAHSKHPEKAMQLLELMNTDKYLHNLINYGIKDVHYEETTDNLIDPIPGSGYMPWADWELGNQLLGRAYTGTDPKSAEKKGAFLKRAKANKTLGFIFNSAPAASAVSKCNAICNQYISELYTGEYDPDQYLPILVKKLDDAGAGKIVTEKQRQLDAWAKKSH